MDGDGAGVRTYEPGSEAKVKKVPDVMQLLAQVSSRPISMWHRTSSSRDHGDDDLCGVPGGHDRQRRAAALWLVVVLAGVAVQFLFLGAEFVAVTQVLVYIGAVIVLFLFGVMLTRASMGDDETVAGEKRAMAAIVGVLLFAVMAMALSTPSRTPGSTSTNHRASPRCPTPSSASTSSPSKRCRCFCSLPHRGHRRGPERLRITMLLNQFLLLSAVLFCLGCTACSPERTACSCSCRSAILNAVNINLAFGAFRTMSVGRCSPCSRSRWPPPKSASVSPSCSSCRNRRSIDLTQADLLKG